MTPQLKSAIESAVGLALETDVATQHISSVGGGCINDAYCMELDNDLRLFAKSNDQPAERMFGIESEGLKALRQTESIRVPQVIAVEDNDIASFLVLEMIESGPRPTNFQESFGRQLALLHRNGQSDHFGFEHDNFLGSSKQPNFRSQYWADFWCENRLQFQLEMACNRGCHDAFSAIMPKFLSRSHSLVSAVEEPPALIHGDLWSGNFLVDSNGQPVLIDPAVYFAHREAEFGMTTLFGGFSPDFYSAYQEAWPFAEGWEERVEIYRLYHLLNHLNLFGQSYLNSCIEIMKKYI